MSTEIFILLRTIDMHRRCTIIDPWSSVYLNCSPSLRGESNKIFLLLYSSSGLIGPHRDKTCYGVSDKARLRPISSTTETSEKIEISPVASLHMVLSEKRITKALIRLRGCAGCSAPVLFTNTRRQVLLRQGPYYKAGPPPPSTHDRLKLKKKQFLQCLHCLVLYPITNYQSLTFKQTINYL